WRIFDRMGRGGRMDRCRYCGKRKGRSAAHCAGASIEGDGFARPRRHSAPLKPRPNLTQWRPKAARPHQPLAFVGLVFDVRAIAQLANEIVELLVALPLPQRVASLLATTILRDVLLAALEHLDQMPAERRAHGLRHLVDRKRRHRALEIGNGVARRDPTEVAALGTRRVVRIDARYFLELRAAGDAVLQP